MSFSTTIEIVEEPIAVDDYLRLVEDVGWKRFVAPASVETALTHSLWTAIAVDRGLDLVVGAVRIVGDGAIFFYVQDLMVMKSYRKQGIGKALVKKGLERCRDLGVELVFVLGHPAYYPKFSFQKASLYSFANEYQADEAFMVIELQAGALPQYSGLVKYAPEFSEIDV